MTVNEVFLILYTYCIQHYCRLDMSHVKHSESATSKGSFVHISFFLQDQHWKESSSNYDDWKKMRRSLWKVKLAEMSPRGVYVFAYSTVFYTKVHDDIHVHSQMPILNNGWIGKHSQVFECIRTSIAYFLYAHCKFCC